MQALAMVYEIRTIGAHAVPRPVVCRRGRRWVGDGHVGLAAAGGRPQRQCRCTAGSAEVGGPLPGRRRRHPRSADPPRGAPLPAPQAARGRRRRRPPHAARTRAPRPSSARDPLDAPGSARLGRRGLQFLLARRGYSPGQRRRRLWPRYAARGHPLPARGRARGRRHRRPGHDRALRRPRSGPTTPVSAPRPGALLPPGARPDRRRFRRAARPRPPPYRYRLPCWRRHARRCRRPRHHGLRWLQLRRLRQPRVVQHRLGYTTWYAHLSRITSWVGESVVGGTRLGYVGATGNATGPHLHFEVRSTTRRSTRPLPAPTTAAARAAERVELRRPPGADRLPRAQRPLSSPATRAPSCAGRAPCRASPRPRPSRAPPRGSCAREATASLTISVPWS